MYGIENFLPYSILLLASVIALFMKGGIVNKIVNIVFCVAGIVAIDSIDGFLWRLGAMFAALMLALMSVGDQRDFDRNKSVNIQAGMAGAMLFMMGGEWIVGEIISCQPTILLTLIALLFSFMMLLGSNHK